MNSRLLFSTVALAALSALTGCGGGGASDDSVQASSVGGVSGSGVSTQSIGGVSGSGVTSQNVGGISGSGVTSQNVGGISGSGVTAQSVGGVSGSGKSSVASVQTACSLKSVNVTIAGARVNADGAADLGSPGWIDVAVAAPVRVDLLKVAAGAALPIDLAALPDGTYRQIRLLLVADDAAAPLADSVVGANGGETALAVRSAAQGGLPLAPTINVASGQVAASFGNLDVCDAVTGAAGTYALDAVSGGATQVASAH